MRRIEIDVVVLFALLGVGLLAPLASNTVLPSPLDHPNHTAMVIQAKMALDEGQLPIRVAPYQHNGMRYPVFQFYSQAPYLAGGLIYKYLTPANPWLALKLVYFCGFFLAGFFTYKAGGLFGFGRAPAVLMGVAYITAPYLLVNVHARGAFSEAAAQFVIPVLAYFTLRSAARFSVGGFLGAVLCWVALATSHVITFVYGTGFYVVLIVALSAFSKAPLRKCLTLLAPCFLGWCISAFQWYPAFTVRPLLISDQLGGTFRQAWLTPLATLLSPASLPPEPLGGLNTPFLHPAVGVPVLVGVIGTLYVLYLGAMDSGARLKAPGVRPCLLLFIGALFCTWSPVNYWVLLPREAQVIQFTYRLLTYTTILGTFLFGWFTDVAERRKWLPGFTASLIILLILAQGFLPALGRNTRSLSSIIRDPDIGYGGGDYLYTGETSGVLYGSTPSLVYGDGWLRMDNASQLRARDIENASGSLVLRGSAAAITRDCATLNLTVDGVSAAQREIQGGRFEWRIPLSSLRPFVHEPFSMLGFQSRCGFVPNQIDPNSTDMRHLWIMVENLRFEGDGPAVLSADNVKPHCTMQGSSMICNVTLPAPAHVQLPMLFYPSLLSIANNGVTISYGPSHYQAKSLAEVFLPGGQNRIVARFAGSVPGAMITWAGLLGTAVFAWRMRRRTRVAPVSS